MQRRVPEERGVGVGVRGWMSSHGRRQGQQHRGAASPRPAAAVPSPAAAPARCPRPCNRYTRATVKAVNDGAPSEEPSQTLLVVMGEKGRSQLQRDMRDSIYATVAGARAAPGRAGLPRRRRCCACAALCFALAALPCRRRRHVASPLLLSAGSSVLLTCLAGLLPFWPPLPADTNKVRVTFPEASAIAEEVRGQAGKARPAGRLGSRARRKGGWAAGQSGAGQQSSRPEVETVAAEQQGGVEQGSRAAGRGLRPCQGARALSPGVAVVHVALAAGMLLCRSRPRARPTHPLPSPAPPLSPAPPPPLCCSSSRPSSTAPASSTTALCRPSPRSPPSPRCCPPTCVCPRAAAAGLLGCRAVGCGTWGGQQAPAAAVDMHCTGWAAGSHDVQADAPAGCARALSPQADHRSTSEQYLVAAPPSALFWCSLVNAGAGAHRRGGRVDRPVRDRGPRPGRAAHGPGRVPAGYGEAGGQAAAGPVAGPVQQHAVPSSSRRPCATALGGGPSSSRRPCATARESFEPAPRPAQVPLLPAPLLTLPQPSPRPAPSSSVGSCPAVLPVCAGPVQQHATASSRPLALRRSPSSRRRSSPSPNPHPALLPPPASAPALLFCRFAQALCNSTRLLRAAQVPAQVPLLPAPLLTSPPLPPSPPAGAVQQHAGEQLLRAVVPHERHGELHQERGGDAGQGGGGGWMWVCGCGYVWGGLKGLCADGAAPPALPAAADAHLQPHPPGGCGWVGGWGGWWWVWVGG